MSVQRPRTPIAEYDAIVVGAGLAGLSAAATLAEYGSRTLVIEKTSTIGGTTAMSGGWFAFSETDEQDALGIADSDTVYVQDMYDAADRCADLRLLTALARDQHEAYDWLKGHRVTFDVVKISSGQTVPRSHHARIDRVLAALRASIEKSGLVDLETNCRLVDLVVDSDGSVVGVQVNGPDGDRSDTARGGVLLASGGFTRSPELIGRFVPEQTQAMPYGGLGNTGDGFLIAHRLGAGYRDTEFLSGTYGSHPDTGIEEHELLTAFYMGAIIVNTRGERFVDESLSYKTLGAACLRQPDGLAFQVFDRDVRAKSQPGVPLSDIGHLEDKGHVFRADSLTELASISGIDVGGLQASVEEYNRIVAGTAEDLFGRNGLCNGVGALQPIDEPPFYAYPAKTLMTSTYCGVTVTPTAEVTDRSGVPIPGLYAAGEIVGGYHGKAYVTGTALTKSLVCGRVAAREMIRRAHRIPGSEAS